jgi:ABC-type protease/lipase transport system fused ATPase/permease subunit
LFADTIAANISRFEEGEDREAILAARMAGVHDMIVRLPNGYDTQVGEGGPFSGLSAALALHARSKAIKPDCLNGRVEPSMPTAMRRRPLHHAASDGTTVVIISASTEHHRGGEGILVLKDGVVEMFDRASRSSRLTRAGAACGSGTAR